MRLFYENILIIKMKFIKKNAKYIGIVMICVFCSYLTTLATNYIFDSSDVRFDNTGTSLESVNVQDAIDETFHHVTDYNEIKTTIGNSTLTTTNKTLIGGINEVNSNLGLPSSASGVTGADAFSKINTLNSKIHNNFVKVVETRKNFTTIKSLNSHSGRSLHELTGEYIVPIIPEGYQFVGNVNVVLSGLVGVSANFDFEGDATNQTGVSPYIYNGSNNNISVENLFNVKLYSLCVKE